MRLAVGLNRGSSSARRFNELAPMDRAVPPLHDLARAKVNLTLRVLGRLPGGYHALESLVVFADFGDLVGFAPGAQPGVDVHGPFARDIYGENLVTRAAAAVASACTTIELGRFDIDKAVPVAAGLGGGSADAAAALRLIGRHNEALAGTIDWFAIAASIGADVPACLVSQPVMVSGFGERLHPVTSLPPLAAVLVNARLPVPADKTRRVFAALGATPLAAIPAPPAPPPATDLHEWLDARPNDLEPATLSLVPGMSAVRDALRRAGCRLARMSGAGPTWFGLFDNPPAAEAAAAAIGDEHAAWWVRAVQLS